MATIVDRIENFDTEEFKIHLGPQHPSTHGLFSAILTLDGEYITKSENVIGYLHRGIEKLAEYKTYNQFIPYTARLDYLAALINNHGYVEAVEKLMGVEVPERAEYIRVIMSELQRIASHLVMLASMVLDLNSITGWTYAFNDRETILDLLEMVTGQRLVINYFVIGGCHNDLPPEFFPALKKVLNDLPGRLDDFETLITGNEIYQGRTKNIGVISPKQAVEYGLTGPNLRASGINFDMRKTAPYSIYDRFEFDVPVLHNGDSFDRYKIRVLEIRQSLRIVQQAVDSIVEGPVMAKMARIIKPPAGEIYHQVEAPKGALGYYLISDGSVKPYRLHIHSPVFVFISALPEISKGLTIQDYITTLASLDPVLGEMDR